VFVATAAFGPANNVRGELLVALSLTVATLASRFTPRCTGNCQVEKGLTRSLLNRVIPLQRVSTSLCLYVPGLSMWGTFVGGKDEYD